MCLLRDAENKREQKFNGTGNKMEMAEFEKIELYCRNRGKWGKDDEIGTLKSNPTFMRRVCACRGATGETAQTKSEMRNLGRVT